MGKPKAGEQPGPPALTHEQARTQMPEYVLDLRAGRDIQAEYAALAAHLAQCPGCRAEAHELIELAESIYLGAVEPAPAAPQLSLAFLRPAAAQARTVQASWRDTLGRVVVSFTAELLSAIGQPTIAQAARGATLYRYQRSDAGLSLTIEIREDEQRHELAQVHVLVDMAERDPLEQAGALVTLVSDGQARERNTDETGLAVFRDVPRATLPHLRVLVAPLGESVP
jgi:hypothetical protein